MAKPNITYFLGAGASCKTLPTIGMMAYEILQFWSRLDRATVNSMQDPTIPLIKKAIKLIEEESRRFNTVDTYAKSLFLNEKNKALMELKVAVSMCFIYWQLYDSRDPGNKPSPNIDHRYISLISAFLEKGEKRFLRIPDNIKFITWNYDIQLELALKYFTDYVTHPPYISDIQEHYKSIPNIGDKIADPTIIHLNGIAGIYPDRNQVGNAIDFLGESYNDFEKLMQLLIGFYQGFYHATNKKHIDYFSYSWEQNSVTDYTLNAAVNVMKKTDILVIIGYSFPVFNRETDRKLFGDSKKFKVYYQDPNADKRALSNIFDIPIDKIVEEKNCEQFLLPHEF